MKWDDLIQSQNEALGSALDKEIFERTFSVMTTQLNIIVQLLRVHQDKQILMDVFNTLASSLDLLMEKEGHSKDKK